MTNSQEFKDGVASGSNELANRLLITEQWGVTITPDVVRQATAALEYQSQGQVLNLSDPYPEPEPEDEVLEEATELIEEAAGE